MSEQVDTGFEDVIAGEKWAPAEEVASAEPQPSVELVTATVTAPEPEPEPPGLTAAGIQAAKSLLQLPEIKPQELAKLAREIAMDIRERHLVLKEYKLNDAQFEFIEQHNEFFKAALHAACIEWQSPLSTTERIKIEAAAILEDSLIGLGARMQSRSEGLPGVIEAAKLFAKVAGVGEREVGAAAPGERFTINIDLGGDQKLTVSSGQAPEASPNGAGPLPIQANPKG